MWEGRRRAEGLNPCRCDGAMVRVALGSMGWPASPGGVGSDIISCIFPATISTNDRFPGTATTPSRQMWITKGQGVDRFYPTQGSCGADRRSIDRVGNPGCTSDVVSHYRKLFGPQSLASMNRSRCLACH